MTERCGDPTVNIVAAILALELFDTDTRAVCFRDHVPMRVNVAGRLDYLFLDSGLTGRAVFTPQTCFGAARFLDGYPFSDSVTENYEVSL